MRIADLNGKSVCIVGFGREGQAALQALLRQAPDAIITVADRKESLDGYTPPAGATQGRRQPPRYMLGPDYLSDLDGFDVLIKSPGIPPCKELDAVRPKITNGTDLFLAEAAAAGAMVIGVTGSKGKSTTASLLAAILRHAKKDVQLVGNIGTPALGILEQIKKNTIIVQEMSSYQLMDCTLSPHIAVVSSFFPEHLDYHGSLHAYLAAKQHITRFQSSDDIVFFNAQDPGAAAIAMEGRGRKIPFHSAECPVDLTQTHLLGEHNRSNSAAAAAVAQELGIDRQHIIDALIAFVPLPHRLQSLGEHRGILWVDDAISTTPDSTIAGLRAVGDDVQTLLLGGQDRGSAFDKLADEILHHSRVDTILLFPGSGPRIRAALEKGMQQDGSRSVLLLDVADMPSAVRMAREKTDSGRICLLSPASPSYGMFTNFEEKGEVFRKCIEDLQ